MFGLGELEWGLFLSLSEGSRLSVSSRWTQQGLSGWSLSPGSSHQALLGLSEGSPLPEASPRTLQDQLERSLLLVSSRWTLPARLVSQSHRHGPR